MNNLFVEYETQRKSLHDARVKLEEMAQLQHRGGKLSMLKEMTMEMAHGYKRYR